MANKAKFENMNSLYSPATLQEILSARENRAALQSELLDRHKRPLISFMLNIPGECKVYPLAVSAFNDGVAGITSLLELNGIKSIYTVENKFNTGYEFYLVADAAPSVLKKLMMTIENEHPLGRFFDIDVISLDGVILKSADFGRSARTCYLCGNSVWECASRRTHTAQELASYVHDRFQSYFIDKFAATVACTAVKALNFEVVISPKPGLVDRLGNGAHKDMDIFTFLSSSAVLYPYFCECYKIGVSCEDIATLLSQLRYPGMRAEACMLTATNSVNTHKGAIFSFGIVCAALGYVYQHINCELSDVCAQMSAGLANELGAATVTNGERAYTKHSAMGARGEAISGFKNAFNCHKSIVAHVEQGLSLNDSAVISLLELISTVGDTNMINRGGLAELERYQEEIKLALQTRNSAELINYAQRLDKEFVERNLSPGGCADILALGLFLYFIENEEFYEQNISKNG